MKKLKYPFCIIFLWLPVLLFAQNATTISGTVTYKSDGTPVVGASVMLKGQLAHATITDKDGNYTLSNIKKDDVLSFSFLGLESQTVRVGNSQRINVELKDVVNMLNEVVAIGYGTVRKSDLTGSVVSVKNEDFAKTALTSLEQGLQGRIAGVEIVQADATPGGGAYVQIRGVSTMMGSSEPLYIVDGAPYTVSNMSTTSTAGYSNTNPLSTLAPSDIASIEVLKDASATAIYGSQGANGVIIITTKRGQEGKSQVTFSTNQSVSLLSRKIPVLNARQYAEYKNEGYANNSPTSPQTSWDYPIAPASQSKLSPAQLQELVGNGIDWQDEIYRPAHTQEYQLSISGGTKVNRYSLMLGHLKQEGILKNTEFSRSSARLNIDNKVNDWFSVAVSSSFTGSTNHLVKTSSNDGSSKAGGVVRKALTYTPIPPIIRDDAGNIIGVSTVPPADVDTEDPSYENNWGATPLRFLNEATIEQSLMNFTGNVELKFDIYKGLQFKTRLGGVYYEQKNDNYFPRTLSEGKSVDGLAQYGGLSFSNVLTENLLTYNVTIDKKHRFDVLVGGTYEQSQNRSLKLEASGFADDVLKQWAMKSALITKPIEVDARLWKLASGFFRANYNYNERYLFTYTVRADGSSKFARNNKWAVFQSGAFAWRIIEEQFLESATDWVSNLKLRLSYGESGNQGLSPYQSLSIMSPTTSSIGNQLSNAYYEQTQENPNLRWETTSQFNVGIDFGFFDERFSGAVNVYTKDTRDLLQSIPMAPSTGYGNRTVNAGRINNKGLEIDLNINPIASRGFTWTVNLNYYVNKNKVVDLGDVTEQFSSVLGSAYGLNVQPFIQRVGEPIGAIYGYVLDGVFQNQAELDQNYYVDESGTKQEIQVGAKIGDLRFKKISDSSPQLNANDQTIIGNTNPDFFFGFNNTFTYKRFDLGIFTSGVIGGDIINTNFIMPMKLNGESNIPVFLYEQAWRGDGTSTTQRQIKSANADPKYFSRQYIEKRTYIRLKSVNIGYKFDTKAAPAIADLKLSLNAVNPFTFTKYRGYDPEVSASSNPLTRGVDMGNYPQARTFILAVTCTLK